MLGGRDESFFRELWAGKLQRGEASSSYVPGQNQRVDKALKLIPPGRRFLDIGCGTGTLAAQLRDRFEEVHGVDIAEAAVDHARRRGVRALRVNLNAEPLPYEAGFFDAIAALSTLQYVYDIDFALEECSRVLRPGGLLVISLPNMRAAWRLFRLVLRGRFPHTSLDPVGYDGGALHYFCYGNVHDLLRRHGFRVEESYGIFCRPGWASGLPDRTIVGGLKREFLSAEVLVTARRSLARQG